MIHQITCRKQSIAEKIIIFLSRNLDNEMINKMAKKYDQPEMFHRFLSWDVLFNRDLISNLYRPLLGGILVNPDRNSGLRPIDRGNLQDVILLHVLNQTLINPERITYADKSLVSRILESLNK